MNGRKMSGQIKIEIGQSERSQSAIQIRVFLCFMRKKIKFFLRFTSIGFISILMEGSPLKLQTYQTRSKQTHIKCHYTHSKIPQILPILFCFIYAKYVQFHNRRQTTDGERLTQATKNRLILNIIGMLPRF